MPDPAQEALQKQLLGVTQAALEDAAKSDPDALLQSLGTQELGRQSLMGLADDLELGKVLQGALSVGGLETPQLSSSAETTPFEQRRSNILDTVSQIAKPAPRDAYSTVGDFLSVLGPIAGAFSLPLGFALMGSGRQIRELSPALQEQRTRQEIAPAILQTLFQGEEQINLRQLDQQSRIEELSKQAGISRFQAQLAFYPQLLQGLMELHKSQTDIEGRASLSKLEAQIQKLRSRNELAQVFLNASQTASIDEKRLANSLALLTAETNFKKEEGDLERTFKREMAHMQIEAEGLPEGGEFFNNLANETVRSIADQVLAEEEFAGQTITTRGEFVTAATNAVLAQIRDPSGKYYVKADFPTLMAYIEQQLDRLSKNKGTEGFFSPKKLFRDIFGGKKPDFSKTEEDDTKEIALRILLQRDNDLLDPTAKIKR